MNRIAHILIGIAATFYCIFASATTITVNSMSRVEGDMFILDTLNNREWLGWDIVRNLSYDQTLQAISPGGIFEGFSIANHVDAQMFVDAMVGPNSCTSTQLDWVPTCFTGENPLWERLVGESYLDFRSAVGAPADHESVKFLNWVGGAGYLDVEVHDITADTIYKGNIWETIAGSDRYIGAESFGWLLFRNVIPTSIPEPSTFILLFTGIFSLTLVRGNLNKSTQLKFEELSE